jgi:hypothetical protein
MNVNVGGTFLSSAKTRATVIPDARATFAFPDTKETNHDERASGIVPE